MIWLYSNRIRICNPGKNGLEFYLYWNCTGIRNPEKNCIQLVFEFAIPEKFTVVTPDNAHTALLPFFRKTTSSAYLPLNLMITLF